MYNFLIVNSIKKLRLIFILLFVVTSLKLVSQKNISKENIAKNYQPEAVSLHPEYFVFHQDDSLSILFYQIDMTELNYIANADSTNFLSQFKISYVLYSNYESKTILDSSSIILFDTTNYGKNNSQIGQISFHSMRGANPILRVTMEDMNTNSSVSKLIPILKEKTLSSQDFYLKAMDGLPLFFNALDRNQTIQIVCSNTNLAHLYVRRFVEDKKPASPPMAGNGQLNKKIKSDTNFWISINNGTSEPLAFFGQGLYFVSIDSISTTGITIKRFTKGFPYINSPMQMLMPLRYLSSNAEFKELMDKENKKEAVDNFWIKITGNEKRAQQQVSIYYTRVQNSNKLFSAMGEGWMSDRGMIYIIFGPPEAVFRNADTETWVYGEASKSLQVNFNFRKQENPLSDNDFLLDRSQIYSSSWTNAIEVWRR